MKSLNLGCFIISLGAFTISACKNDKAPLPAPPLPGECDTIVYYSSEVLPIVATKCASLGCHDPSSSYGDLTQYNPLELLIENGKLQDRVFDTQDMPPAGNPLLTDTEKKKINCWIEQGASNN